MNDALSTRAGTHIGWRIPKWHRFALPIIVLSVALVLTGCYDDPYYGRGRGYTGVYASYGPPGPYYGRGYGYDPYSPYYGRGYVGPGYGSGVVAVRTGPRRGYYADRRGYRRAALRRDRREFRRGREIRRGDGRPINRRRGARSGQIEANTQPE